MTTTTPVPENLAALRDLAVTPAQLLPWTVAAVAILVVVLLLWRLARLSAELRRLRSRLHGERVRGGVSSEALAPLLDDFPVDVTAEGTSTAFLGQPIDYVHFDPQHGVTFIEVKSGSSQLSAKQRQIRDCVERGAVHWAVYRVR